MPEGRIGALSAHSTPLTHLGSLALVRLLRNSGKPLESRASVVVIAAESLKKACAALPAVRNEPIAWLPVQGSRRADSKVANCGRIELRHGLSLSQQAHCWPGSRSSKQVSSIFLRDH
jgi:hypothetical protein